MGDTIAQKLIRSHLVSGDMSVPGSEIGLKIDQTLTQDATGTMAYLEFEAMGVPRVKTERSVAYIDHNTLQTGFENADIVFLTDGLCELPEDYLAKLHKEQTARKFTVTGILLDAGTSGMDFSLMPFCQKIYRTSELTGDEIMQSMISQHM